MAKNEIDEQDKDQDEEKVEKKSGLSTVKIIIIAVVLTIFVGGGLVGGTYYFVSSMDDDASSKKVHSKKKADDEDEDEDDEDDEEDEEEEADEDDGETSKDSPATYHSMDPKFIVSFGNQKYARFMQFSLNIMSRDKDAIANVETHMPVVRSNLLMLFGSQEYEVMVTRKGKEKLLEDVAFDINATLQKVTGTKKRSSAVEAAYFTSFVIQ